MQANRNNQTNVTLYDSLCSYIALCNEVMDANQTRFPYIQIWRALESEIAGRPIEYSVVRDTECARVTASFVDLKINITPSCKMNGWPNVTHKFEWPYMSSVLNKPAKFIANPALVDWNIKIDTTVVQLFS